MATEQAILRETFEAAEDLSDYQYHFVVLNTSGKVRLPDTAEEVSIGVLQNAPESGDAAEVMMIGKSKVTANAALTVGKFVGHEYVGAADAGKASDLGANRDYARGMIVEAASAEDDLASVFLFDPRVVGPQAGLKKTTVSSIATADAVTYTAAQLLGGLIVRDPAGGARSDVSPTAALLIAAITQAGAGDSFEFTIKNAADAAETITLTAGTDVTLVGTMTIAQNNTKRFLAVVTSPTEVTIYSLGTVVH